MDTISILASSALFRGLTRDQCASFAPIGRISHVPEGEHLFRLGEPARMLFVVHSGIVELTMPLDVNGRAREVVVEHAGAGETVAWSALIEPYRFTLSARAGTDVELVAFTQTDLQAAIAANTGAGIVIMTNIAKVIARRLHLVHTMWNRELQRTVSETFG